LLVILDSVVPHSLIAWAELSIDSGLASVLISTMPMFTVAFAALALPDERLSVQGLLGLGVGFLGVIVLTSGGIFQISSSGTLSMLAVVAAAASYGVAAVYARILMRRADPLALTGTKLALGVPIALALTLVVEGVPDYGSLSLEGSLALAALGILSTGIAFVLYFWLVSSAGSVYASLVTYIVPVVGLSLGWAVLGEEIGLSTALGAALIALGVAGVMHHPKDQTEISTPAQPARLVLQPGEGSPC
jgi:drug/metabolite transporter (DMT)-like permease